ncbi:unnamed protein product [Meloidogyne enterolobii]|uniref:Uncharacterized protein n=1 Tax=Meloidogyne enterolobii TaxID=390850 RepID=A0ACB0XK73_MELEN
MAIKIFNKHASIHGPIAREAHTDTIQPSKEDKEVQTDAISEEQVVPVADKAENTIE